jgi:hypothetical protein
VLERRGGQAPPDPHAPGPFAFADPERVRGILEAAGFAELAMTPHTLRLGFGEAPTLSESVRGLAAVGTIGRLLADQPEEVLERVYAAMGAVLQAHCREGALDLAGASGW